jgi:APA family basic amino acid/polyamine antiporter
MSIWRIKPVSAFEADMKKSELKRVLGKWSLTAIGIGAIIGGGIFVLTGTGAYYHAGPALAISFIIAGIACVFAALCYSEFASILPVEGSAYAYAYGTIGEIFAWIIGWGLILEYAMGSMTVAVSWSGYFNKLLKMFGIKLPDWLTSDPASYTGEGFSMNLTAFLIVIFVIAILIKGTKSAANANNFIFHNVGDPLVVDDLLREYPYADKKDSGSFLDRLPDEWKAQIQLHRKSTLENTNIK